MPIYIAKDYNGKVEGVVLAKNEDFANVFWQGKGIVPHSIVSFSEGILDNHITGVLPIVHTKLKNTNHLKNDQLIRIVCKD